MSGQTQVPAAGTGRRTSHAGRALAIVLATVANVLVWTIAKMSDVTLQARSGANERQDVTLAAVIIVTLLIGLVGWALLAVLERLSTRGLTIWTVIAVVFFLISLLGPLGGVTTGAKVTLAAMHIVTAAVLIPAFRRTSGQR
jgi:hypothetical protein